LLDTICGRGEKNGSTYIVPHNAVFCVLKRNPPQATCLGGGNAAHFGAYRESVHSTNKCIEIVFILSDIPTTVQVSIGRLEALQLGIDSSKLLSEEKRLLLFRKGLVYSRSNSRANFGNGELLGQHMCDVLKTQ